MRYTEARLAQDRPRDAGRHRQGDRRLRAELRRDAARSRWCCRREVPNLLVNGSSGIAVGMATNIPPHNLTEVVDGLVRAASTNPEVTIERADEGRSRAPTSRPAATSTAAAGIREAYTTGRGIITLRAKAHVEKMRGGREAIIVTELPYQVNKATLIEKIAELVRDKKIEGISEIRDESNREGIRVVLELGRGRDRRRSCSTSSTSTPRCRRPSASSCWPSSAGARRSSTSSRCSRSSSSFRREVVTRRTRYDLARAEERAHILEGLRKARRPARPGDPPHPRRPRAPTRPRDALMTQLELSRDPGQGHPRHAAAAPDRSSSAQKIVEEHEQILAAHRGPEGHPGLRRRADGDHQGRARCASRRSTATSAAPRSSTETTELTIEDLLADEEMVVTITRSGYIKRTHVEAYRSQRRGGKGVTGMETKEEDIVEDLFVASTHSYLLFFTNTGKVHWLKVHEIPEGGPRGQGQGDGEPALARRGRARRHLRAGARLRRRRLRLLRHPAGQGEEDRARRPSRTRARAASRPSRSRRATR